MALGGLGHPVWLHHRGDDNRPGKRPGPPVAKTLGRSARARTGQVASRTRSQIHPAVHCRACHAALAAGRRRSLDARCLRHRSHRLGVGGARSMAGRGRAVDSAGSEALGGRPDDRCREQRPGSGAADGLESKRSPGDLSCAATLGRPVRKACRSSAGGLRPCRGETCRCQRAEPGPSRSARRPVLLAANTPEEHWRKVVLTPQEPRGLAFRAHDRGWSSGPWQTPLAPPGGPR